MKWKNTLDAYGTASMLFHWLTAAGFLSAYVVVYYVIWVIDPETSVKPPLLGLAADAQRVVPLLNIHWVLGITLGVLTLPRLAWRLVGTRPAPVPGSRLEHLASELAHRVLYGLLLLMPISGYMTTYDATDFGLFVLPACRDTAWAGMLRHLMGWTVLELEEVMWAMHSFLGKRVAWVLVVVHVGAALMHHFVRRDTALRRMLPWR